VLESALVLQMAAVIPLNFLIAALWSETSLVFPALQMLEEGYGVYAVEDASGGTSKVAHDAAIRRIEQAGAVSLTAFQVLLEFQRDWSRKEHYEEVIAVAKEHCGAYGQGIEYAATMVQKPRPVATDKPQKLYEDMVRRH
jgi:hypothetical protein